MFLYSIFAAMYLLITRMRLHGKPLEQHQIRTATPVQADVVVSHQNSTVLGRYCDVASVQSGYSGTNDVLPPLYDVRLSNMGTGGFVLSGLELHGSIAFGQAWWCRPV